MMEVDLVSVLQQISKMMEVDLRLERDSNLWRVID
jgi:hypothetical protein